MNNNLFKIENRRYLGNKNKLLEHIQKLILSKVKNYNTFLDLFSGTGVVSSRFNEKNNKIISNDILESNFLINKTFLYLKKRPRKIQDKIIFLNNLKSSEENYFSKNFGGKYFSKSIAKRIGAIRDEIDIISENLDEKIILITSLIFAFDKIANTVGHYDAYREVKIPSVKLKLMLPEIDYSANLNNEVYCEDSNTLVRKIKSDVTYIDPPYNSRQYSDTYHLLENVVSWRKPRVYGKASKLDRTHIKSRLSFRGFR